MPDKHDVKPGDCILSIVDAKGFFWETLWEHPENGELREKRLDPNTLLPGGGSMRLTKGRLREQ